MKVFKSESAKKEVYDSYEKLVEDWGVPVEERDLDTTYGTTHVIMAGDVNNPPMLAFHGVGDNSAIMWMENAKELAKHFRFIAIDTMGGAGKSVPNEQYEKSFDLVRWYGEIADSLKIKKTFLIGVSYGAYQCQLFSTAYPDLVEKMVPLAGYLAAEGYETSHFYMFKRMMKYLLPEALFPSRKNAMKIFDKLSGSSYDKNAINENIMDHFYLLIRNYRMQAQFVHKRKNFNPDEIEIFKGKSLFLVGDVDELALFPRAKQALEDFKMNFKIYTGVGHTINYIKPREIEQDIIRFCVGGL